MRSPLLTALLGSLITDAPVPPENTDDQGHSVTFHSSAHKGMVVHNFELWLRSTFLAEYSPDVEPSTLFNDSTKEAATLLLSGEDFRTLTVDSSVQCRETRKKHLAQANQTQFVERGVKDCQTVAKSGRMEEQRSCYGINRSFNVFCEDISRDTGTVDRIGALIGNVEAAVSRKKTLISMIGEDKYEEAKSMAKSFLTGKGHYKNERVQSATDAIVEAADKNKVSNAKQKVTGVEHTALALGLVALVPRAKASI